VTNAAGSFPTARGLPLIARRERASVWKARREPFTMRGGTMAKRLRARLDPEDVLRGRVRPDAEALCALVRAVNPTGTDLPAAERARRYAIKTRLQSLLVLRFAGEVDVLPDAAGGDGIVLLRHRPTGATAGHAVLRELDDDARSWAQRQADLQAIGGASAPASGPRNARQREAALPRSGEHALLRVPAPHSGSAPPLARAAEAALREHDSQRGAEATLHDLLLAGQKAEEEYDYEIARAAFEEALRRFPEAAEPAVALLDLLVERLGADADALAAARSFGAAALAEPGVRRSLALAAARTGDRGRARSFLHHAGDTDAAAVLAALGRRALTTGDVELAARDLAEARARDPAHPELRSLDEAIERAAAASRRPAEERVVALASEGRFDEAEAAARHPAVLASTSAEVRKALRAIDEHRRRARAAELVASAERALASDEPEKAIALLRQAIADRAEGLAPRVEDLLARAESEGRERKGAAAVSATLHLLAAADRSDGLVAYVALPPEARARVREAAPAPELSRLDETGVTGAGARARAAVAAVLALSRAERLASSDPDAALDLIQQHARLLDGVRAARAAVQRADAARRARRRDEARRRFEKARDLLGPLLDDEPLGAPELPVGAVTEAHALLSEDAIAQLPEPEQAAARALRRRASDHLVRGKLASYLAKLVAKGEIAQARAVVETHLDAAEPGPLPLAPGSREQLRGSLERWIQRTFDVAVAGEDARDLEARGLARAMVTDAPVPMPDLWGVSCVEPRGALRLSNGGRCLVDVQARGTLVFLRVVDVAESPPLLRTTAVFQTPQPTRIQGALVSAEKVVCVDRFGAILAASLPDLRVLSWHPPMDPPPLTTRIPELSLPHIVQQAAVTADGRFVWTVEDPGDAARRLRVLDLQRSLIVHEEPVSPEPAAIEPVSRVPGVAMAVLAMARGIVELRRADGALVENGRFELSGLVCGLGPHPAGGVLVLLRDRAIGSCSAARLIAGAPLAPPSPIDDLSGGIVIDVATDMDAGRVFVLHEIGGARFLVALRAEDAALAPLYRAAVPHRSALLADATTPAPRLLVIGRGAFRVLPLGAAPPDLPPDPAPLPCVRVPPVRAIALSCHPHEGPRPEAVQRIAQALRQPHASFQREIACFLRRDDPDELYDAARAFELIDAVHEAEELDRRAFQRHPTHPLHRLQAARFHAAIGAWGKVRSALRGVDEARLDDASARHFAHLLGLALLDAGEHAEAHQVLLRGRSRPGPCELDELIAIAAPPGSPIDEPSRPVRELLDRVAAADARLSASDPAGALALLDDVLVWEACELQSMARLARAALSIDGRGPDFRLRSSSPSRRSRSCAPIGAAPAARSSFAAGGTRSSSASSSRIPWPGSASSAASRWAAPGSEHPRPSPMDFAMPEILSPRSDPWHEARPHPITCSPHSTRKRTWQLPNPPFSASSKNTSGTCT
jgi:tetratricopeptide (TPR) repeat protein